MPTTKQIEANRMNARKSSGPKTVEGKARSSQNAVKFGFFSRDPVVNGEDEAEWRQFRDELVAGLAPAGRAQEVLAERVADCAWRLRRFPVVEAALFNVNMDEDEGWLEELRTDDAALDRAAEVALGRAFLHDCRESSTFVKLARYESAIERAMYRNLQALERLQGPRPQRKLQNEPNSGLKVVELAA